MAIKLSPLTFPNQIRFWVISSAYVSSVSCAKSLENLHETNPKLPNSQDFEGNIQYLRRNKLVPDNLIRVMDNTDDLSSAVKIFKWASLQTRFRHTQETYSRIILKLGLAGNAEEMEGFCQNMVRDKIPGTKEALLASMDEFVKHHRLSEAVRVLVSVNSGGYSLSIETVNGLMCALVREKGEFRDVLLVYKEMVKARILPNVETLNCLLEALFEADRVETALEQFKRMEKKGCAPNSVTFEIIIKGLFTKNRVDEAIGVLDYMFESGVKPELGFFRSVIPLLCRENKPKEGLRLFRMVKDCNFEFASSSFKDLIKCLCKNLWLDETISVVEEMIESGSSLPDDLTIDVVNLFCELGKVNEAANFLEEKRITGKSPHDALLLGCYRAGKLSTAIDILWRMSDRNSNTDSCDSWNIVIRLACELQGIRKASELLGRMIVSGFAPDSHTYSALVVGNCEPGKYDTALRIFSRIRANYWVLDSLSYSKLVDGLCSIGMVHEAARVFRYMSLNDSPLRSSSSFGALIRGLCAAESLGEAAELFRLARYPNTPHDGSTYDVIMQCLLKENRLRDLSILFSQLIVIGCGLELDSFRVIFESMKLQNRVKDCVLIFNSMVSEGLVPDSECLLGMLSFLASRHQLGSVLSSVEKLVSRDTDMNSSIYNVLINSLWREGKENEAQKFLDRMLEKGWVPDTKTHGLLTRREETSCFDDSLARDTISEILVEGLEIQWHD